MPQGAGGGKVCARGGGGRWSPLKEGGGFGKGALVTGQSQEAGTKTLKMTHHLRREAARKNVFFK